VKGQKEKILTRNDSRHSSRLDVFLFFPHITFLKTILNSRTNGTFGFARHTKPTLRQNKKSHILANVPAE
jgi:hypothetical protein